MTRLNGKAIIITGASKGIGAAVAELFAREGANVVLGARSEPGLAAVARRIEDSGGDVAIVPGDVADEALAQRLVATALSRFGGLDAAVNNAGTLGRQAPFTEISSEDWRETIDTNLTGAFFGAKHQLRHMAGEGAGSVVFVSSFVGQGVGFPQMAPYAASKAALVGMTQCLSAEFGPRGVRVNALMPGGTRTAMAGDFSQNPDAESVIAGFHALKRMAEPHEIARAALFLVSDEASFVTGSALYADGGNAIAKL